MPAEAGIIYAIDEIARFEHDYRGVVIGLEIKEYPNLRALATRAQGTLAQGRAGRASVDQQAAEYMDLLRQLRDAVHLLQGGRDDINAMIEQDRAKEQTQSRRFLLQFATRTLAVLVAAIALIWTIWQTLPS